MKTGGFIRRKRRAKPCFDISLYRSFGKNNEGCGIPLGSRWNSTMALLRGTRTPYA